MSKLEVGTIWSHDVGTGIKWVIIPGDNRCRRLNDKNDDTPIGPSFKTILGRLPPDQLDATEWKDEYKLPEDAPENAVFFWRSAEDRNRYSGCWSWEHPNPAPIDSQPFSDTQRQLVKEKARYKRDMIERDRAYKTISARAEVTEKERDAARRSRDFYEIAFRASTGSDYDPARDYSESTMEKHIKYHNALAESISRTTPLKKGPRMSIFTPFKLLAKPVLYTAIAALCLNLNTIKDTAVEWWTAPTALELGDWLKVNTCTTCNRVRTKGDGSLCPKCGEEGHETRKAQNLVTEKTFFGISYAPPSLKTHGYVFADGTVVTDPGHWVIPEREVKS